MGRYKKVDRNITKKLAKEIIRLLKERPTFTPGTSKQQHR